MADIIITSFYHLNSLKIEILLKLYKQLNNMTSILLIPDKSIKSF